MAIEICVPRLGWNMEEGVFIAWHKKDGESVKAGEPLFVLEGDKATQDVEATDAGILRIPPDAPAAGTTVAVGTILGYLVELGEPAPFESGAGSAVASAPAVVAAAPVPVSEGTAAVRDRQRRAISPRARRVARELGVDWTRLTGSGRTGRIRESDVRAAVGQAESLPHDREGGRKVPVSRARRIIAERMQASLRATAPVTLTTTADATNLVNLRAQFKTAARSVEVVPGYTDFLVKLCAVALNDHPMLRARWEGDRLLVPEGIHIGLAVDTETGLRVPVLRDVPSLGLRQIAERLRGLTERARAGKLTVEEMSGGVFTISNLGPFGIDTFTPIINYPECAILGVGRLRRQPEVIEDRIVARDVLSLSLTFDHRTVDGAPAARFLDALRKCIENPAPWLVT
jgi:pyruvate dehydrogenase E2 component (dihydrolipoamide acetyltransferase)